ncbi:MAG: hypothetical protein OQK74_10505, partial [Gammaproteobacteria bacterium]|nr:hypothetical protein [Gammaproteobacteria bacterium]
MILLTVQAAAEVLHAGDVAPGCGRESGKVGFCPPVGFVCRDICQQPEITDLTPWLQLFYRFPEIILPGESHLQNFYQVVEAQIVRCDPHPAGAIWLAGKREGEITGRPLVITEFKLQAFEADPQ